MRASRSFAAGAAFALAVGLAGAPAMASDAPPAAWPVAPPQTEAQSAAALRSASGPRPQESGVVRLMGVGDVNLARGIGKRVLEHGRGVVFAGVKGALAKADVLVINLECTLASVGAPEHKHYTFRANPVTVDALVAAGVDVAGQANNHGMDFGPAALKQSIGLLRDAGIGHPGAGLDRKGAHAPYIVERNGLRLAFLAYVSAFTESTGFNTREWEATKTTPGLAIGRPKVIAADVHAAAARADLVIVSIHAGYEGFSAPNHLQRRLARAALDAGATLVIGAHPHVLQGYRRDGHKLVAYSMGNFVFPGYTGRGGDTAILDVTLTKAGVTHLHWIPVVLRDGLPVRAYGTDARRILRALHPV